MTTSFSFVLDDDIGPVVDNFDPADGTPISRTAPISFDITDNSGVLALVIVSALYPASGVHEVVWHKDHFTPYFTGSSRAPISGGYRYTVRRSGGGWPVITGRPGGVTIHADAVDEDGFTN